MAAILMFQLMVLLHFIMPICCSANKTDCPALVNITSSSPIVTKKNELAMNASTTNSSSGTVVRLQCNDYVTLTLSRPGVIRCTGGKWDPPQPHCVPKPPPPVPNNPHLDVIIGGVLSGCVVVLILVSIPEVVKRWRAWRLNKLNESAKLIEEETQKRFYKVWTCGRNTKQFIKAKGLSSLKREASRAFSKPSVARIVLEEDGTEVDTDDILDACGDQTLMALAEGELWWDRNINSEDGRLDAKRLTFDVCNQDRTKRKLVLVTDLRDLYRQGQFVFGYLPSRACLESDGTFVDQDVLFAFAESTIMLLEQGGVWSPTSSRSSVHTLPNIDRNSVHNNSSDDMMFKVWTIDQSVKLVVFARNLADLHIKAAKSHGLPNPVEISNLSTGDVITSDIHLASLANEVLVIRASKNANVYQYIDHEPVHTVQNDLSTGGRSDEYAKVQKNWPDRARPRDSTSVLSTTELYGDRRSVGFPTHENGHVGNGFITRGNGHVPNGMSNSTSEDDRYAPLPSKPLSVAILASNERNQNNSRNSFIDMTEQDPRSTPKNNFGFLRDMSEDSHRKNNVHEMSEFYNPPVYPHQSNNHSELPRKPMIITGGAKQTHYSDVLF